MPDAPLLSARAPSGASVGCYLISDYGVTSGWIVEEDAGDRAERPGSIREAGARPVYALANFLPKIVAEDVIVGHRERR